MKKGPDIETETNEKGTSYRDRNSYNTKNTGYRQKITKKRLVQRQDNKKETGYRDKIMKKRLDIETVTNEKEPDIETGTNEKWTRFRDRKY